MPPALADSPYFSRGNAMKWVNFEQFSLYIQNLDERSGDKS